MFFMLHVNLIIRELSVPKLIYAIGALSNVHKLLYTVFLTLFPIFLWRLAIQAFLRGSSVVVSAPTSSGKTLIAEAAAVATVARGRRLFYTTPLKALSNQKFRDFR